MAPEEPEYLDWLLIQNYFAIGFAVADTPPTVSAYIGLQVIRLKQVVDYCVKVLVVSVTEFIVVTLCIIV